MPAQACSSRATSWSTTCPAIARLLYNAATINGIVSSNSIWGLTAGQMAVGSATVSGTTFLSTRPTLDTSSRWQRRRFTERIR